MKLVYLFINKWNYLFNFAGTFIFMFYIYFISFYKFYMSLEAVQYCDFIITEGVLV